MSDVQTPNEARLTDPALGVAGDGLRKTNKRDDKIAAKKAVYAASGEGPCPYPAGSRLEKFWNVALKHFRHSQAVLGLTPCCGASQAHPSLPMTGGEIEMNTKGARTQ